MRHAITALILSLGLSACQNEPPATSTQSDETAALETDTDKTLYALGQALATNVLKDFQLTDEEAAIVSAGLTDGVAGRESKVDMQVYGPRIQDLARERISAEAGAEKDASAAFLEQMAKETGAERSTTGMIYIPISAGTGANPTADDSVRVHYHGTLRDGTVFDSSVERGEPITFPLTGVIPCWTEGVQKIKVGGKAKLVCPSETAYGDGGQGPIPGGATLVFEVELIAIEGAE
jgi:FKBP-type peptidyl-prolyl cis-trans isomerase FkpA